MTIVNHAQIVSENRVYIQKGNLKDFHSNIVKKKDVKCIRKLLLKCTNLTQAMIDEVLPNKLNLARLKFHAPSRLTVYQNADTLECLFFDLQAGKLEYGNFQLFPTMRTLWKYPDVLDTLEIHSPVSAFILNGADVMVPGISRLDNFVLDEYRVLKVQGNPMPMGIGQLLMNGKQIRELNECKGKIMNMIHVYGDPLYQLDSHLKIPNSGFTKCLVSAMDVDTTIIDQKADELTISEPCNSAEMDHMMKQCFLKALKFNLKKSELPMLASTFYGVKMLPCRPKGVSLNIKASSYKKILPFLLHMETFGCIELSNKDGIVHIVDFRKSGRIFNDLDAFITELDVEKEKKDQAPGKTLSIPKITELYELLPNMRFALPDEKIATIQTREQLRSFLLQYIESNKLKDRHDPRYIILNPELTDAIYQGRKQQPGEAYPTMITIQDAVTIFLQNCKQCHSIQLSTDSEPKIKKKPLPTIEIRATRLGGNKTATTISNLEAFDIDPQAFTVSSRQQFACSCACKPAKDSKKHVVVIQGNVYHQVTDILAEKYGILRKCIKAIIGKGVSKKKKT